MVHLDGSGVMRDIEAQIREGFTLKVNGTELQGSIRSFHAEPTMYWNHEREEWMPVPLEVQVELVFYSLTPGGD